VAEKELSQYQDIGAISSVTKLAVMEGGRNAQAPASVLASFVGTQLDASGIPADLEALKAGQSSNAIYADTLADLQAVVGTYEGQGAFVTNGDGAGQYRWDGVVWQFLRPDTLTQKADSSDVASQVAVSSSSGNGVLSLGRTVLNAGSGRTPGGATLADLRGFPVAGYLSEIRLHAGKGGPAKLKIIARSNSGDTAGTVVDEYPVTLITGSINTFVAGRDFPTTYVQAGWTWGIYTDSDLMSRESSAGETMSFAGDAAGTTAFGISSYGTMWGATLIAGERAGQLAASASDVALRASGVSPQLVSMTSGEAAAAVSAAGGFTRVLQYGFPEAMVLETLRINVLAGGGYARLKVLQKNPADWRDRYDVLSSHAFRPVVGENLLVAGQHFPKGLTVPKNGAVAIYTSTATLEYDAANDSGGKAVAGDATGNAVVLSPSVAAVRFGLTGRYVVPEVPANRVLLAEYFGDASTTVQASGVWDFSGEGVLSPNGGDAVLHRPEYSTLDPTATAIRFRVVDAGAVFGVGRRAPELYGSVAVYDALQGVLQLLLWPSYNSAIPTVAAKQVAVPFTFAAGEEGVIELRHEGRINTATITKSRTRESVSVTTGNPGDGDSGRCWGQPCVIARAGRTRFLSLTYRLLASRRPRLVCGIDSITEGFNLGDDWASRWGNLLRDELGIEVVFAARGGGNTVDLLRRATLDISALRPDFYALLAVTNERNDAPVGNLVAWKKRMRMVVEAIRATGAMPVLITAPATGAPADAAFINAANAMILAGEFGPARVVDAAAALSVNGDRVTQDQALFLADRVHPTVAGHRRLADQFLVDLPEVAD